MSISSLMVTSPASVPASALRREAARRFGALGHPAHDDDEESRDEVRLAVAGEDAAGEDGDEDDVDDVDESAQDHAAC